MQAITSRFHNIVGPVIGFLIALHLFDRFFVFTDVKLIRSNIYTKFTVTTTSILLLVFYCCEYTEEMTNFIPLNLNSE